MADLFEQGRKALGAIGEESSSIAQQVMDWKAAADSYSTAAEFNRVLPDVRKMPEILKHQVAQILMDAAAKKQIPFDSKKREFVAANDQPTLAGTML
jgi:hypothetical protein